MYIKIREITLYQGEIVNRCPRCDGPVFWNEEEMGVCVNCGEEIFIDYKTTEQSVQAEPVEGTGTQGGSTINMGTHTKAG